jgi:deoxyadenosine/deoxycytidine kinase
MARLIAIEGNIGVGKSTLIDIIKNNIDNCEVVNEPVDMWLNITNEQNENILELFYKDISRWSYSFQNIACVTRMIKLEDIIKSTDKEYIFLDRSLGTDKHVFEKMLYDSNNISEIEHKMYNIWFDFYEKHVRSQTDNIIIYLRAMPQTCLNRIQKRNRNEEKTITLEYLEKLHKYHDDWLLNNNTKNVVIIDYETEFENDINFINTIIDKIKSII